MKARPLVGSVRVVRIPMVVDLPAPLGPSRPYISPARISRERPSRATTSNFFFSFDPPVRTGVNEKPAPGRAIGGGVLYTLRRFSVRIPTAILQFLHLAARAVQDLAHPVAPGAP